MQLNQLLRAGLSARKAFRRWREVRRAKKAIEEFSVEHGSTSLVDVLDSKEGKTVLKGKLTYAMIAALAAQLVAGWLGIDVAPTEVDALVGAATVLGAIYGRWRATK